MCCSMCYHFTVETHQSILYVLLYYFSLSAIYKSWMLNDNAFMENLCGRTPSPSLYKKLWLRCNIGVITLNRPSIHKIGDSTIHQEPKGATRSGHTLQLTYTLDFFWTRDCHWRHSWKTWWLKAYRALWTCNGAFGNRVWNPGRCIGYAPLWSDSRCWPRIRYNVRKTEFSKLHRQTDRLTWRC